MPVLVHVLVHAVHGRLRAHHARDAQRARHPALDQLPEHFRLAIVLSDIEGLSYKEIAKVMNCPVGTVMSRLHRARKVLQTSLRDQAVALGIVADEEELGASRRAAVGDPREPLDLAAYRSKRSKGGRS